MRWKIEVNSFLKKIITSPKIWNSFLRVFAHGILLIIKYHEIKRIRSSPLYDGTWYRDHYQDVNTMCIDSSIHYAWLGWKEMRNPGPRFCTATYIALYSDLLTDYLNPLVHYEKYGRIESFNPCPQWTDIWSTRKSPETCELSAEKQTPSYVHTPVDRKEKVKKILFIGHEASGTGAPRVLLYILRWLHENSDIELYLILLDGGPLLMQYHKVARVWCLDPIASPCLESIQTFCDKPDLIYGNTFLAAKLYGTMQSAGIPIMTHVHEMEDVIFQAKKPEVIHNAVKYSSRIIAVSDPVAENLEKNHGYPGQKITVIHDFIEISIDNDQVSNNVRSSLKLPDECKIILGCGTGTWRKGIDLFVHVARKVLDICEDNRIFFLWVGEIFDDERITNPLMMVKKNNLEGKVIFPGFFSDTTQFFKSADIFLLTSREDPFPLVALEACEYALPIICFEDSGGMPSFIKTGPGYVVPSEDVDAMALLVRELVTDDTLRISVGKKARKRLLESYTSEMAVPKILKECNLLL
jgi:glycosyltransferase involved in cell wall biosynthesis